MFTSASISLFLLVSFLGGAESHGYLKTPRSRNFIAAQDGVWWGGTSSNYPKEDCPQCASIGGTAGQCGVIGDTNYDENLNVFGQPMPPAPQANYARGQEIEVDVILTAHHKGHFEFHACPIEQGGVASGGCLTEYPLEFVSDPLYGAPKDIDYPYRAYIAPPGQAMNVGKGNLYRFRLKLPENLSGELVLLQWHYLTANSCTFAGYSTYPFPASWGNMQNSLSICDSIPPGGGGLPEQFWGCAEISISGHPVTPTSRAPVPAPPEPTPQAPLPTPPAPIPQTPEVPAPTSPCGGGSVGNGVCSNSLYCCSEWGYCGTSAAHCNGNPSPTPPAPIPQTPDVPAPVSPCGSGSVGNGVCSDPLYCCSEWGYCGTSAAYCNGNPSPTPPAPIPQTPDVPVPVPEPPIPQTPDLPSVIDFPDYADGDCSGIDDVMTVNFGYYQSWAVWRQEGCNPVLPEDIDVTGNGYSHLAYTFASINANYELEPWAGNYGEEVPQYQAFNNLKQMHPGLKTVIAVGGWTFNDPGATQTRFSDTAITAGSRAVFAASCVDFCREYGFDGVDLDWEYPGDTSRGGKAADKTNYGLLVQAIRAAFDAAPEDFELSMAIPVADWRLAEGYDLPALAQGLDFFNLMAYDIHGVWDNPKVVGANTDMPFIFDSVKYFLDAGVSPSKLVFGLAAYGRTYNLVGTNCATAGCAFSSAALGGCAGEAGFMPYFTIDEYIQNGSYNSLGFNPRSGTMELVINNNVFISYDSVETMEIKHDFASKACFRGFMWWAVDMKKEPIDLGTNPSPPGPAPGPNVPAPAPEPNEPVPAPEPNEPVPAPEPNEPVPAPEPNGPSSNWQDWLLSTNSRCGTSEADARGNCRTTCISSADCATGQYCWGVHANYCGSKPQPEECNSAPQGGLRCGPTELVARETCGMSCSLPSDCDAVAGEYCLAVNPNYCGECGGARKLRGGK